MWVIEGIILALKALLVDKLRTMVIVLPGQQKGITGGTVGGAISTLIIEDAKSIQRES